MSPAHMRSEPFTDPESYKLLLLELDKLKIKQPIFAKLSPDLDKGTIDKIIKISDKHNIQGFICTNLTKIDKKRYGGYSGQFVKQKSNNLIKYLYKKTRNKKKNYVIIGTGGIASAEDAYEKIKLGASLLQLITGMIYQGPGLISEINQGLVQFLERDGYKNISKAIGVNNI
jgi:dihydroorotate dehydrogenase